jgi:Tfp pilus assembly protein PilX
MTRRFARGSSGARQLGASTLVLVMVLFFVMAMVAAYSNRNLVFEQRIGGNYYRAAMAQEAAEAGAEWALGALNGDRVDASCQPAAAGQRFRDIYLGIAADRRISRNIVATNWEVAACARNANQTWQCDCPSNGVVTLAPAAAPDGQIQPMFGVRFAVVSRPGVVRVTVQGATDRLSNLRGANLTMAATNNLAQNTLQFDAALVSALKTPPASPLTVRGSVDLGTVGLGLHNAHPETGGLLMQTGQAEYRGSLERSSSTPGTPAGSALIRDDASLRRGTGDDMFRLFFGMAPQTYRQQAAMREVRCDPGDCAAALSQAITAGADLIWVDGNARIGSNTQLGSATRPVVLVVDGALQLEGPMLLNGLIYARGDASWSNGSGQPARLIGALLSEGDMVASGTVDIAYDAATLNTISNQRGSFVRVPGSWMDATQ